MTSGPLNLQGEWARLLVAGLVRLGARDFVVSPGSRSTPLALALLAEQNERGAQVRVHSVIDERAAGFFALGLARSTGVAPVLICTSGTAPAHYYPALIEAYEARLPLLVLSADRPPELQEVGAAQTIRQNELFGQFVAYCTDLGAASARSGSFEALAHKLELAWSTAESSARPVHLNAPFYKPLEPGATTGEQEQALRARVELLLSELPRFHAGELRSGKAAELLEGALAESRRPLFVLGVLGSEERIKVEEVLAREASARGLDVEELAIWSEVASGSPHRLDLEVALRAGGAHLEPDCVFQFGARTCSSRYLEWLARTRPKTVLVQEHEPLDPTRSATLNLSLPLKSLELPRAGARPARDSSFLEATGALSERVRRELDERLFGPLPSSPKTRGEPELEEARAVALIARALPQSELFVGNSLPLRITSAVLPRARATAPPLRRIFVQRGVNGIDGLMAGAAGLASAPGEGPVSLFLGDVSAAHDLGALALLRETARPVWVWIFDNGGGHIFDQLPLGKNPPEGYELWRTPPRLDFAAIAAAYGLLSFAVESEEALKDLLASFFERARERSAVTRVRTRSTSANEFLDSIRPSERG